MYNNKAAVFIILGQSNAVGHGVPMEEKDKILVPLKNVFGLHRKDNQSFENKELVWSGYTSCGMNLGEEQDNTYSIPNCLAALWQKHIDEGNKWGLPDLYIVQIAIGAQGVTGNYMWNPEREKKLIPGKLGQANISLFPFSKHIFELLGDSFTKRKMEYEVMGVHWRGGENDVTATKEDLMQNLEMIYKKIFTDFNHLLQNPPIVLHKLVCPDYMRKTDRTGSWLEKMYYVNEVFSNLEKSHTNISVFDPRIAPQFIPDVAGNGIFIEDFTHFTPDVNKWIADFILKKYGAE